MGGGGGGRVKQKGDVKNVVERVGLEELERCHDLASCYQYYPPSFIR